MMDLGYEAISHVVDAWELAKQTPAFEEEAGMLVLTKLFELEPRTKKVFGFSVNDDLETSPRLKMGALLHAKRMIHMFDAVVVMLGPDTELLSELLAGLGKRHIQYGVKANFIPFMGQALLYALKKVLGNKVQWQNGVEDSWNMVYEEMSSEIMRAILTGQGKDLSQVNDTLPTTARDYEADLSSVEFGL